MPPSAIQQAQPSRRRFLKSHTRPVLAQPKARDLAGTTGDLALRLAQAPPSHVLLTMAEAADYLRYTGKGAADSAYHWLKKHGVALERRGTVVLARLSGIDAALAGKSDFVARALAHREKR